MAYRQDSRDCLTATAHLLPPMHSRASTRSLSGVTTLAAVPRASMPRLHYAKPAVKPLLQGAMPASSTEILLMGDFNDEPNDLSLLEGINAFAIEGELVNNQLYNLSWEDYQHGLGTIVYKEINNTWFLFDHIIVSGSLIIGNGILTKGRKSHIFKVPWLLKDQKPFRTYQGPIYKGGYSDHLPIFIDLYRKQ